MATWYSCRECEYNFVLSDKGFHTADVKTHCNKIMRTEEVSEQEPRQPLEEKDAEIERLRLGIATVRGGIIGALRGGHMEGKDGASYSKQVLLFIAESLGIDIPDIVKREKKG